MSRFLKSEVGDEELWDRQTEREQCYKGLLQAPMAVLTTVSPSLLALRQRTASKFRMTSKRRDYDCEAYVENTGPGRRLCRDHTRLSRGGILERAALQIPVRAVDFESTGNVTVPQSKPVYVD